ncbi:DEAD/DEAH box helicase family protein [uncultured Mediterranea sp.]|uniref:DEAD/DEAH box helicase family protein n=1 Tax=uncultured Mediterranea sp. TaxID=1926662 RepID=UPI0027D9C020|nr:DEAD/DEAH box helicase family protein [uncultured Mediterranea sp.]
MNTTYINIEKEQSGKIQYLTEVLPQIPTNTILYKKLTGLGATYGELKADRNSIILEPNVPVIKGKCKDPKHTGDNLFGVYENVTVERIVKYLQASKDKHIKLLSTPESFSKIKSAFDELDMDIYSTCYLLFDECHKIVKDVDYREDITLPFDDFFMFENKGLVSATPLDFTDPRFFKQKFQIMEIQPNFEYAQPLNLYHTNNVLQELKKRIGNVEKPIFLFINSTETIYSIMDKLDILEQSTVFCASNSVTSLKDKKFTNAYSDWDAGKMKRFNFLTSRFFNALDIELDFLPEVFIVTDTTMASQSMVDPFTDTIQIIGRFRNGIASANHITNTDYNFSVRSKAQLQYMIGVFEQVYGMMKTCYDNATTDEARDAYKAILDTHPFKFMLNRNGEKNWFKIDNYITDAIVQGYYNSFDMLAKTYRQCKSFKASCESQIYPLGDLERLKRENKSASIKAKRKEIVKQLEMLKGDETSIAMEHKRELIRTDAFIVEAYEELGREKIEELNYSQSKIREAMILKRYNEKRKGSEFVEMVKNRFKAGQAYELSDISKTRDEIYKLMNMPSVKKKPKDFLGEFFKCKDSWKNRQRALFLEYEKL